MDKLKEYFQGGVFVANLVLENYHKLLLAPEEVMLWIHLSSKQAKGNLFPDLTVIAKEMGLPQERIFLLLNQLVGKKMIEIQTIKDVDGKQSDQYNLTLLFERLAEIFEAEKSAQIKQSKENDVASLYQSFETEFGRPLSPIEYQRIGQWLEDDQYQPELIQLALREAVLNQAYNLNYVDRILIAWQKKNLTTKSQVQQEQSRRKSAILHKDAPQLTKEPLPKVSLHNWLQEDKHDK